MRFVIRSTSLPCRHLVHPLRDLADGGLRQLARLAPPAFLPV